MTGFVEASVTSYLGIQIVNLGADEKAELLFVDQLYELLSSIPSATLCFFLVIYISQVSFLGV